jgi:hypothetical protein
MRLDWSKVLMITAEYQQFATGPFPEMECVTQFLRSHPL